MKLAANQAQRAQIPPNVTPVPPRNPYLHTPLSPANTALLRAFERSLKARRRSDRTIASYLESAKILAGFLAQDGIDLEQASRADIELYLIDELERTSPGSAAVRFRSLGPLFSWMAAEEYVAKSPMAGLSAPKADEKLIPVLSDDDLRKLVKACAGRDIWDRRDEAIIRLFIDTGIRVAEMISLTVDHVDMSQDEITVLGKGRKQRRIPFGAKTGQSLERYLRLRRQHPLTGLPAIWLGNRGMPLTANGISQMLQRRADAAGIGHIHPHQLRHTAAHYAADSNVGDDATMRIFGWTSRSMLNRYGSAAADERARRAMRRLSPGDRL